MCIRDSSVGAFDVSLGIYHDIDTENTYVELGAGTSFDLTDNISLDLGATIGNNQDELLVVRQMVLQLLQSQ